MRKTIILIFSLVLGSLLVSCSGPEGLLTRVDVQKVNEEGDYEDEVIIITDQVKIDVLRSCLENVKWEPHIKPEMTRKEDVFAVLFFTFDKNMPERLYEYRIWFNENGTTTIISNNEKEGYGRSHHLFCTELLIRESVLVE